MSPVSLRPGRLDDAWCLGALGTQVFLDTYCAQGLQPHLAREALLVYHPDRLAERLQDSRRSFILMEQSAHLIGFAELQGPATAPSGFAGTELARLYLSRHFHGQGLGAQLLRAAEHHAAASGGLWLTAWSGNTKALGFYAAQGYEDQGPTHYEFEGQRFENRILGRALTSKA